MKSLDGKWKVEGNWLAPGDVKHIKGNFGYNRWFGIKWGKFDIEENKFIYRNGKVIDEVRFINSDKLEGEFFLDDEFIGNFTMTRISQIF